MLATAIARRTDRVRPQTLAYTGLLLSSCFFASAFIAGKVTLHEVTPNVAALWRYVVAVTALLPWAWASRPNLAQIRPVALPLSVMVLCGGVLYQVLFLMALQRTTATNTSLLIALNPLFTLMFGPLVGQRFHPRRLWGVAVALAGAAIVITHGDWQQASALAHLSLSSGDILAVGAALTWAAVNVASQRVVGALKASFANGMVYGIGATALAMLSWNERPLSQLLEASGAALGGIVVMGLGSSVLGGQLFLFGVRVVGVSRAVMFIYFVPVLTALAAVMLLGEPFYLAQAVGGAAVICGVYWTSRH